MEQLARPKATHGCGDSRGLQGQGRLCLPSARPCSHLVQRLAQSRAGDAGCCRCPSRRTTSHHTSSLCCHCLITSQKVQGQKSGLLSDYSAKAKTFWNVLKQTLANTVFLYIYMFIYVFTGKWLAVAVSSRGIQLDGLKVQCVNFSIRRTGKT